jgi:predicted nucleic-acid-binding protein
VIALDTSVLARLLIGDDPDQQALSARLLAESRCSVSWSVLVELCWVLERSAMFPRVRVAAGLARLAEIENIEVPDDQLFGWALQRYGDGADFADMVHLATVVGGSSEFATFDRKLSRQAGRDTPIKIATLRPGRDD